MPLDEQKDTPPHIDHRSRCASTKRGRLRYEFRRRPLFYSSGIAASLLVETRRIELLSESIVSSASPSAVCGLL